MSIVPHKYICIEGNIGAGKTTLCKMIERDYPCKLLLEQFTDNPFLPYFYKEPDRYAFPLELFFLTERYKQLQQNLLSGDLFHDFILSDYSFVKTLLYAKNNLSSEEYRLFTNLFNVLNTNFPWPDVLVYIHRSIPILKEHIKMRGRLYETEITDQYLQNIQDAYFEYFRSELGFPILIIDADKLDFLKSENHYLEIKRLLEREYQPGIQRISIL